MLFNSFEFVIFFPVVTLLYFLVPHSWRIGLLLIASCIFYMAFIPAYVLILFVLIVIDYWVALEMEKLPIKQKKPFLILSILATCLALLIFKYFNFFSANVGGLAHLIGWNYPITTLQIILPIGLSFHTFQSLAYIIEVYKGEQKAERNFWVYALYVMFYPQLVAGPIERPANLLHQFYERHDFDYQRVTDGLKLMAWGLFKKVVIADRFAIYVNQVYGTPTYFHGPALVLATLLFAFQIYCDFSGYSDIAIGAAQVMGFKLMDNFNRPYFSRSISEFWKRWHISLSTWFRDYLFMPLSGSSLMKRYWYGTLFITFLVSGLWHGANWTYVVWGALNGIYLLVAIWTSEWRSNFREKIGLDQNPTLLANWQVLATFLLICFSWVFFRAFNMHDAIYILLHMPQGWFAKQGFNDAFGLSKGAFLYSVFLIGFLIMVHRLQDHGSIRHMLRNRPLWLRWGFYYAMILGILFGGVFQNTAFIYFQF